MTSCDTNRTRFAASLVLILVLAVAPAVDAQTPTPDFSKSFDGTSIGPGSTSTLTFTIDNSDGNSPVTDLQFTDNLPAGIIIASPSSAATTCTDAIVTAPDGGSTISFTGDRLGAFATCTAAVNVIGNTPGTHLNVSGDLTSSAGNSGAAEAELTVDVARPGFSKFFFPNTITAGQTSTLTLTINNSANGSSGADILSFSDFLPSGVVVADFPNASTDCYGGVFPPILTADPGTNVVSLLYGFVSALSTCEVTVDVTSESPGEYINLSGELAFGTSPQNAGKATARLVVEVPALRKVFTDDPAGPGGTVTLEFTVTNLDRGAPATGLTFTDDLSAVLPGLEATVLPADGFCGPGSQLTGTGMLTFSNGSLGPGESCTFSATLQVPAEALPGAFPNTTSSLTSDSGVIGDPASDVLFVVRGVSLTKQFTDDPVAPGGTVTLEFTLTNSDPDNSFSDISFTDNLTAMLAGTTVETLPADGFCGPGSQLRSIVPTFDDVGLSLAGASLDPGASCIFSAILRLDENALAGTHTNTTSVVESQLGGEEPVATPAASDDLIVVGAPTLTKAFTDDPVNPGDLVTLEFTIDNSEHPEAATAMSFTDNLEAALSGLQAVSLPADDFCGPGSQMTGTGVLTVTGASLDPEASCTFSATLQVPSPAAAGTYTNTTSSLTATVGGIEVTSTAAQDDLDVTGLSLAKEFTDDPAVPGETVTLEFTITNTSPVALTGISFTDDLASVVAGLQATGLPASDICGVGSQLSGPTLLSFTGGSLDPGGSCTFSAELTIPTSAEPGEYTNTTSDVTSDNGFAPQVSGGTATDVLIIAPPVILLKEFTDDPVAAGGTVTLEFTITNNSPTHPATDISFGDDLNIVLPGLEAIGLPASDVCGAGSQIAGTSFLSLTGGNLPPAGSCTFSVTLQIPAGAPLGTFGNVTTSVTSLVNQVQFVGDPATDQLEVAVRFPVELTEFTATGNDGHIRLSWQTASETNNAGFGIQSNQRTVSDLIDGQPRSVDARPADSDTEWQDLAFVEGHGTTNQPQSYSYLLDEVTPGTYRFRLKQIDFDGSFEYSPEIEVAVGLASTHVLSDAYPNPFNPSVHFNLIVAREQQVVVAVYDVAGRLVRTLHEGILPPNVVRQFRLDAEGLAGGLYIYRAEGETFAESKRVMLVK